MEVTGTQTPQRRANDTPFRRAGAFIPSLFTVGNMALGFYAIIAAGDSKWTQAAAAIFVGHVLDILDGRIARFIGHSSRFGGEFDSFADLVSFGMAPAIMIYLLVLRDYGKLGFLLAFFFALCSALRLARFNLKSDSTPSTTFVGLPTPGAGGCVAMLVLLIGLYDNGTQGRVMNSIYALVPTLRKMSPVIVFGLALLMVSKVQYMAFKKTRIFRPQSLRTLLITVFALFMMYAYPQNTIFIIYVSYILWGLLTTLWRAYRLRRHSPQI